MSSLSSPSTHPAKSTPQLAADHQEELHDTHPDGKDDRDFAVKFEGSELPKIRRKVCRKIYAILMSDLGMDKAVAKVATLNLEYRLHSVVDHIGQGEKAYLNFVKNVLSAVKANASPLQHLHRVLQMTVPEFGKTFKGCQQ